MSANLSDSIDLHSDATLVDGQKSQNDVHGVNVSIPSPSLDVARNETVVESLSCDQLRLEPEEPVVDEIMADQVSGKIVELVESGPSFSMLVDKSEEEKIDSKPSVYGNHGDVFGADLVQQVNGDQNVLGDEDVAVGFVQNSKPLEEVSEPDAFANVEGENVEGDVDVRSPSASKMRLWGSDLVWGKVRSHPWWPGQIFDQSSASKVANKHFKKGNHLIAYFGDQTFAWNEPSRIKSFRDNFLQMEKQSNLEDFHYAIECVLDEVSRRVEYGLACSCIPTDVYDKIKTQSIVNAGVKKESREKIGGDSFTGAALFEPAKLINDMKNLACLPCHHLGSKLEIVTSQAQLLAFYRWKGYTHLPKFLMLGALLEHGEDILQREVKNGLEVTDSVTDIKAINQDGSSKRKHKKSSGNSSGPVKKKKTLADMLAETRSSSGKKELSKPGSKLIPSPSDKKRKADEPLYSNLLAKHKESQVPTRDDSMSPRNKQTFTVGASILRVASQLSGSSPILRHGNGSLNKEKSSSRPENLSLNEMLSQLCSAAKTPLIKQSSLKILISFFMDFRNSVRLDHSDSEELGLSSEQLSGGNVVEKLTKSETTRTSECKDDKDSYTTNVVGQDSLEEQVHDNQNNARELIPESKDGKEILSDEPQSSIQPVSLLDESIENNLPDEDDDATALILNFTNLDSVSSIENLIKIFSPYGNLHETETEILNPSNRAKVVFKRRVDAETAFSSAGKYSIFGPSLLSYRLQYGHPKPCTVSQNSSKRIKKDSASAEESVR